jgi:hypothetical protein
LSRRAGVNNHVSFIRDVTETVRLLSGRFDLLPASVKQYSGAADLSAGVRETIGDNGGSVVYFDVPNAEFMLAELDIGAIIYEHCSYFGRAPLVRLFSSQGFKVQRAYDSYEGIFLAVEAAANGRTPQVSGDDPKSVRPGELARSFADRCKRKLADGGPR